MTYGRDVGAASPRQDGKSAFFEPAVGVSESSVAHPSELVFDAGALVGLHAVFAVGDLLLGGSTLADLGEPLLVIAAGEFWGGSGDLFGVHEDSPGQECGINVAEEVALGLVAEVVDGKRGDDGVPMALEGMGSVVGYGVGGAIGSEALAGAVEHGVGDIDEVEMCVGEFLTDESG